MNDYDKGYLAGSDNEKLLQEKRIDKFTYLLRENMRKGMDLFTYNFILTKLREAFYNE
jgi:hypothetical protein